MLHLEASQGHGEKQLSCLICLINGGGGVKLFKSSIQVINDRNITVAFSEMQIVFYSLTIDENIEYITGNGYSLTFRLL